MNSAFFSNELFEYEILARNFVLNWRNFIIAMWENFVRDTNLTTKIWV